MAYSANWGGHTEPYRDESGTSRVRWVPFRVVKGTAYDTPIQGYGVDTGNTLRLWVSAAWTDTERWTRMSILNTARGGKFSSDRSIREYCDDMWGVDAVPVRLPVD